MKTGSNDISDTVEAEGNLQDVIQLIANLRRNKEILLHCCVFIELKAKSKKKALKDLTLQPFLLLKCSQYLQSQISGVYLKPLETKTPDPLG